MNFVNNGLVVNELAHLWNPLFETNPHLFKCFYQAAIQLHVYFQRQEINVR